MQVLLVSFACAQANPGVAGSAKMKIFDDHRGLISNFILEKLNTVKIPNITAGNSTSGIDFQLNDNWYMLDNTVTNDMVQLVINETANSVSLVVQPLMAKFTSKELIIKDGPIKTTGVLEADIFSSVIIVGIQPATRKRNDDNLLIPYINPYGVSLTIDPKQFKIRVDESLFGNYLELITKIFQTQIIDGLQGLVVNILNKNINRILNSKILTRQGVRTPFHGLLTGVGLDWTIPYQWKITEEHLLVQWNGAPFVLNNITIQGVQETELPWFLPESNFTIQVQFGTYFLNNFIYSLLSSNPDLSIKIGYETLPIPFDIETINYALPGMYAYYGWVNRNCTMYITMNTIQAKEYYTEEQLIGVWGDLDIKMVVHGVNLDGTDQLAVHWHLPNVQANGTAQTMTAPFWPANDPRVTISILSIEPGIVETVFSSFGYVNTLFIQQAFAMLMQTNANLFPISVLATQKYVNFPIGPKVQNNFFTKDDWEMIWIENGLNIGFNPIFTHDMLDEFMPGSWTYPGDQEEDDYPLSISMKVGSPSDQKELIASDF